MDISQEKKLAIAFHTEAGMVKKTVLIPEKELAVWAELYDDHVEVQRDGDGNIRHFSDIDQEHLKTFILITRTGLIRIPFKPDKMELVHYYHNQISLGVGGGASSSRRYPVLGYKDKETGHETIVSALEDGSVCVGLDT